MYLQDPVSADLFSFIAQGRFDCIRLGQRKEWILSNFPDPDSQNDMGHNMSVWLYGNMEFHFEGETLFLIHCDNFNHFGAGPGIALDKWLLSKDEDVTLADVLGDLHQQKVSYTVHYSGKYCNAIIQIVESTAKLYFELDDGLDYDAANADDFIFDAFSLLHPDYIRHESLFGAGCHC